MVAAVKGYRMLVVMPNGMSGERLAISQGLGAQVMTLGDFHVNDALAKVAELGRQPNLAAAIRFKSNVEENRTWLQPRNARSAAGQHGPGRWSSRGRRRGHHRRRGQLLPQPQLVLQAGRRGPERVVPADVRRGPAPDRGHLQTARPGIFARHRRVIDGIVAVDSDAAVGEMRRLAREFGLFVGRAGAGPRPGPPPPFRPRRLSAGTGGGVRVRREPGHRHAGAPARRPRRRPWPAKPATACAATRRVPPA